jgi:cytochrome c
MKNASIIGLLIIGLIFQNCKNNEEHPSNVSSEETETSKVMDATIDPTKELDSTSHEWVIPVNYQKMKNPTYATEENLIIGKALYTKHCKSCHGISGKGDGPKGDEFDSDIGDFSSAEFQSQTEGTMFYKSYVGQHDMPNNEKEIPSPKDMWFIVNHLKTLQTQESQ